MIRDKYRACVKTCLPEWVSGIFTFIPHYETAMTALNMFLTAAQYDLRNLVNVVPNPTHRWRNLHRVCAKF